MTADYDTVAMLERIAEAINNLDATLRHLDLK